MESLASRDTRKQQLTIIQDVLEKYEHKIFCGDFNFDSSRNFDERDKNPLENDWMIEYFQGYNDIWPLLHPNEKGYTFDTEENGMIKDHRPERMRYDRIMCSSSLWKPQSIYLFGNTSCGTIRHILYGTKIPLHLSDHFGLISEISLQE